mmetsp:Transcript_59979/g.109444  ORF Transcript_59979/g.109444 Transcript_59979/m.109444 type:complete len:80 (+) Transcript_59979:196-435(+)
MRRSRSLGKKVFLGSSKKMMIGDVELSNDTTLADVLPAECEAVDVTFVQSQPSALFGWGSIVQAKLESPVPDHSVNTKA